MQKYQKNLVQAVAVCLMLIMLVAVSTIFAPDGTSREAVREVEEKEKIEEQPEAVQEPESAPKIALTFDDGPRAGSTDVLLDGLKERGVKATFFVIGVYAEQNPELIKRIDAEGHLLGNHTYNHVDIRNLSNSAAIREIQMNSDLIESITGKPLEFVRPPFGAWQESLEREMDVIPAMWTVDPLDWTTDNVDEIVNKVVTKTEDGDIILLHDCYKSSVAAALRIVDILSTEGYEFVTIDEIILD